MKDFCSNCLNTVLDYKYETNIEGNKMNHYDLHLLSDVLDLQDEYEFRVTKEMTDRVTLTFVTEEEIIIDLDTMEVTTGENVFGEPEGQFKRFFDEVKEIMRALQVSEEKEYLKYKESVREEYYYGISGGLQ